jgi:hypothetical protein
LSLGKKGEFALIVVSDFGFLICPKVLLKKQHAKEFLRLRGKKPFPKHALKRGKPFLSHTVFLPSMKRSEEHTS